MRTFAWFLAVALTLGSAHAQDARWRTLPREDVRVEDVDVEVALEAPPERPRRERADREARGRGLHRPQWRTPVRGYDRLDRRSDGTVSWGLGSRSTMGPIGNSTGLEGL